MADVFVSYSSEDRERLEPIVEAIERAGFSVWWDRRIGLGSTFDREIERELAAAACVIVLWSARSVESDWVRNEAQEGLDRGVLVPLSIDDVKPPLGFRRAQTARLDSTPTSEQIKTILTAVALCLNPKATSNASDLPTGQTVRNERRKSVLAIAVVITVSITAWLIWLVIPDSLEEGASDAQISSLAVLPLNGIGLPSDSQWLTLGIPSELTSMLSSIPLLTVASESGAYALYQSGEDPTSIGESLAVQGVIAGTLQAKAELYQLKVELIRVADGSVVWRESFEARSDELRDLQIRLAGQVFKRFGAEYSPYNFNRPITEEAYRAHLNRVALDLTSSVDEQLKWAELTIALEPDYAMGYINAVFPYLYQAINDPTGPWQGKVRMALDRAVQLGLSDSAEYKAHEGLFQWIFNGDLNRAEQMLRESFLEGDRRGFQSYLRMMAASGLHDSVLPVLEELTVTEPYDPLWWGLLSNEKAFRGDYLGAAEATTRSMQLTADSFFDLEHRAILYSMAGDSDSARQDLEQLRTIKEYPGLRLASTEALIAHWEGDETAVREAGENFSNIGARLYAGMHFLLAGDSRAQEELALAADSLVWFKYWLDGHEWRIPASLRESEVWQQYRASLGYTDSWRLELCRRVSMLPDPEFSCDLDPQKD